MLATTLYMPGTIETYTSGFGLFRVTMAIVGWLLGSAGIVVASAVVEAELDRSRAPWALGGSTAFGVGPHLPAPTRSPSDRDRARRAPTWSCLAGSSRRGCS